MKKARYECERCGKRQKAIVRETPLQARPECRRCGFPMDEGDIVKRRPILRRVFGVAKKPASLGLAIAARTLGIVLFPFTMPVLAAKFASRVLGRIRFRLEKTEKKHDAALPVTGAFDGTPIEIPTGGCCYGIDASGGFYGIDANGRMAPVEYDVATFNALEAELHDGIWTEGVEIPVGGKAAAAIYVSYDGCGQPRVVVDGCLAHAGKNLWTVLVETPAIGVPCYHLDVPIRRLDKIRVRARDESGHRGSIKVLARLYNP